VTRENFLFALDELARGAEADDVQHVLGARASSTFLPAAV
jgi:hypothetical protein